MRKPSKELRDLYTTYLKKRLRPENALEFASGFILDLINVFGEKVEGNSIVAAGHIEFSPFNFLLQLNELLARYKQDPKSLDDVEKSILRDTHLMIGTLIRSALNPPTLPAESNHERYQLPADTASDLEWLVDNAS